MTYPRLSFVALLQRQPHVAILQITAVRTCFKTEDHDRGRTTTTTHVSFRPEFQGAVWLIMVCVKESSPPALSTRLGRFRRHSRCRR